MKWSRRALKSIVLIGGSSAAIDYACDHIGSRNIRALYATVRIAYEYKTFDGNSIEELNALHEKVAKRILNVCLVNEGLYIKLGQGMSTMNHIMPREWTDTFKALLDHATTTEFPPMRAVLETELGGPISQFFRDFNEVPIASASIAQVYKATLVDGTAVAVKIQKPSIARQIPWDLRCYHLILWMFENAFDFPLLWSFPYQSENLRNEINFLLEAEFSERTAKNFAHRKDFYVPKVIHTLTTSRVLIAEWIDGTKLSNNDEVSKEFNTAAVLQCLMEVFADMIFRHGLLHCDPHPGNMLVRRLNGVQQVVLLDHGLSVDLPNQFRLQNADFWHAIFIQDFDTLKRIGALWGIGEIETFVSLQMMKPYSMARPVHSQTVTKSELLQLQVKMKDTIRNVLANHDLVPPELVFVGRSTNLLRSLNRSYGAPVNRVNIFASRAARALRRDGQVSGYASHVRFLLSLYLVSVVHHTLRLLAWVLPSSKQTSLEDLLPSEEAGCPFSPSLPQPQLLMGTND